MYCTQISVTFLCFSLVQSESGLTTSRLIVQEANQNDAGEYSCSSDAGNSNSTAIHVITGLFFSFIEKNNTSERNRLGNVRKK